MMTAPTQVCKRRSWAMPKRSSPPRKDPLFRALEDEIGLEELMAALALSAEHRALALLELLADPAYSRHTLATLCRRVGLTYIGLFGIYRRVQICRGLIRMYSHLPDIMEDMAIDSLSRVVPCHRCEGSGRVSVSSDPDSSRACADCCGSGVLRIPGDTASRELLMKLLQKALTTEFMSPNPAPASNLPSLEETIMLAESVS